MALSREARLHADWLGMLQPEGLVVSIPVLEEAAVYVRLGPEVQAAFRELSPDDRLDGLAPLLTWLAWPERFLVQDPALTRLDLPDLSATVEADHALLSPRGEPLLLVRWSPHDLDAPHADPRWPTSPQERFERLLIEKGLPVGLHVAPDRIRLTYAPAGEAPGRLTFPVTALRASDGRILVDALQMLLGRARLYTAPAPKRLLPLLQASRKRQDAVTVKLAGQVEEALRILLAGFDAADVRTHGRVLRDVPPDDLYGGLTTVLLRLVFLLYAEDRALLPTEHPVYAAHYALGGLAERLQHDQVMFAGAMDRRFGAWGHLCTLFRLVYTGARHRDLHLPPRQGDLFDPGRYPFLEGRPTGNWRQDRAELPPVDDGVVAAVLDKLLHLEGQRISYRNLEVEQIGSVYEALMGFDVRRAAGPCLPTRPLGVVVELHDLREASDRVRWLAAAIGDRPARLKKQVPELEAFTPTDDVDADLAALQTLLQPLLPRGAERIPPGCHYLQPGEERRRSGSHYTPRALTEPIVARTLGPVLDKGGPPTPERILSLKVCDPAMGSGAFLAEACRYLARRLVEAWGRTGTTPPGALEQQDPELYARRLVAERCLYGVDKNPRAVQLARLSLWLVTSVRDLPFTFVDHALKEGDALIGLDLDQVASFSFDRQGDAPLWLGYMRGAMQSASRTRAQITAQQRELMFGFDQKKTFLEMADDEIWDERRIGDLVIACAWAGGSKKAQADRLKAMGGRARAWYPNEAREPLSEEAEALIQGLGGLRPFHWWLEFPEVFVQKDPGFDCVIGNPPFGGKNTISGTSGDRYIPLLQALWPHAHGASDLAAYFFLRTAGLLRKGGTFGLVATNTISQGNTRDTGLKHLVNEEGITLYDATVDIRWPVAGAAVVVSIVHGVRGRFSGEVRLDGEAVTGIASDLRAGEELPDPVKLKANAGRGFQGSNVLGRGFVLDLDEAAAWRERDPRHREVVRDYIGGKELNSNVPETPDGYIPHERCVIHFGDRSLEEAEAWPELLAIVRERVKPERDKNKRDNYRLRWWLFGEARPGLYRTLAPLERCLACSQVSKHLLFAFQPADRVFAHTLNVFPLDDWFSFAVLQSRIHEAWARSLASSMKTDMRYTPSTCFETFPFPRGTQRQHNEAAAAGEALYDLRQRIMVREGVGMTQVWNQVEDPDCLDPDIVRLRELREAMDRAVLAAYGWPELDPTDADALLPRLRKLNAVRAAEERRG